MNSKLLQFFTAKGFLADGFNTQGQENNLPQTFLLFGFGILFFYFLLWRPEQKRRKAADKLRGSLKVGDRVVAMGIIGIVDKVQEDSIVLKMCDDSKIEMLKVAVSEVYPGTEESADLPPSFQA
ncbi:preprotein translocase subunit YajC [Rhabdochlamydiaceae symbiont of Dictyostelium giganteum]|uniref:preprotein translocase subunit YajC n=1 Tax=Rhabdochlamydiaceae symbiont of Dictyostelium giganteum TaxID=3342349 RepID=UPI00384DA394